MSLSLRSSPILRVPHPFRVLCGMGGMPSVSIAFLCLFVVALPARAANQSVPTPQALARLEQRAAHAKPSDQCFLYTELVHGLTQQAAAQLAADDTGHATATLRQIDHFVPLIHLNLSHDTKRLKDAEKLLHDTTYRLGQLLHLVSGDDRATVQQTLRQLNQINDELLNQVFNH